MDFLSDTVICGVLERRFALGEVPGVLFSPSQGSRHAGPLVLLAHGGGQHAAHPAVLSRARRYAGSYGFTVAALDAPGHGGRPRSPQLTTSIDAMPADMAGGAPAAAVARLNAEIAAEAVPEWRAVLDGLKPDGHHPASVGFVGFSLGAAFGVPLIASEPRIAAAVLGLVGRHGLATGAARITVPAQLVVQWDDELVARDDALALFTAIGSSEKRLHVNPGGHARVPAFERESAERFLAHHLGDIEVATVPHGTGSASRGAGDQGRLRRGIVLRPGGRLPLVRRGRAGSNKRPGPGVGTRPRPRARHTAPLPAAPATRDPGLPVCRAPRSRLVGRWPRRHSSRAGRRRAR